MKELFYFSKSDLMIQVQLSDEANSIRYASHRNVSADERSLIEKYIHENIVTGTSFEKQNSVAMSYLGIDDKLICSLNQFHAVKPQQNKSEKPATNSLFKQMKNKDIDKSVKNLINTSMENYYFEKIGSTIVELREIMATDSTAAEIKKIQADLRDLIEAYNQYTTRKVDVKDLLPNDIF